MCGSIALSTLFALYCACVFFSVALTSLHIYLSPDLLNALLSLVSPPPAPVPFLFPLECVIQYVSLIPSPANAPLTLRTRERGVNAMTNGIHCVYLKDAGLQCRAWCESITVSFNFPLSSLVLPPPRTKRLQGSAKWIGFEHKGIFCRCSDSPLHSQPIISIIIITMLIILLELLLKE